MGSGPAALSRRCVCRSATSAWPPDGQGRIRTYTDTVLNRVPLPLGYLADTAAGGSRTHTLRSLSPLPLPLGYRRQVGPTIAA